MSQTPVVAPPVLATAPINYLERAMAALRELGLGAPQESNAPAVALVSQLATLDEGRVVAIARVLQQSGHFNAIMRDEISSARVSDRYTEIVRAFDSIRDDATAMVEQVRDGKVDLGERLQNLWMKVTRGDIPSRFDKIRRVFLEVSRDATAQLEREARVLEMYADFRLSIKDAEIQAHELLALQTQVLAAAKGALQQAQDAIQADLAGGDAAASGRLAIARDEALRTVQREEARYQLAKDLAENLQVNYATSEAIMLRVHQSHEVKRRVNQRSVVFFSTNETSFTALNLAFTTQLGLHESTQTLNAMTEGTSKGLEAVASIGDEILHDGLKAGYGPTLGVDSVRKLVDAVVRFQETSLQEIETLRAQATRDSAEISAYVEQGKQRFAALVQESH
ncbi:cell surface protein [Stenotrophomonas sp.]|uniref:cell surface protein n=1 Tax=Stenotrophomonas sp. TaxID=69392 RepID=UPI002899F0A1|nr:cell surface protein [Stenotrophomonas sp.]